MKIITSGLASSSFSRARMRSSNCPRYFVPATMAVKSRLTTRLLNSSGEVMCLSMSCARPSTIALFPTPGSPMSMGLFFLRRHRISVTRWISFSRPTTGSSFPSWAACVRSVEKLSSTGVFVAPCFLVVVVDWRELPALCCEAIASSSYSSSSSGSPSPSAVGFFCNICRAVS